MSQVVHTIKLREPVDFGSEKVTELKFQKLLAGHLWDLDVANLTVGKLLTIGANASGVSIAVMKKLGTEDMMEVVEYMGNALGSGPATGPEQSAQ